MRPSPTVLDTRKEQTQIPRCALARALLASARDDSAEAKSPQTRASTAMGTRFVGRGFSRNTEPHINCGLLNLA
jgi:hypothetical protein